MKNLIGGIVAICLGLWGVTTWWASFGLVMRGIVPFALIVLGLLAVVTGFRRLSNRGSEDGEDEGAADDDREPDFE